MRSLSTLFVLPCALVCLVATGARAQQPQQPAEQTPQEVKSEVNPWLSMKLAYGATLDGAGGGPGHLGQSLSGGIDHEWLFRRGTIDIGGTANKFIYAGSQNLSQFTFGGALSTAFQMTPRARVSVSDSVTSGYARQATVPLLTDARLLFPTALTRANSLGGSLGYLVSPRTQVQESLQYTHVTFTPGETSTPDPANVLAGGESFSSRLLTQRQVSRADALGVVYEYSLSRNAGTDPGTTQALRASWQRALRHNFTLHTEGGLSAYLIGSNSAAKFVPTGAMTLSRRLRDSTVAVRVERFIEVFGATHVSRVVNPTYSATIGRHLTIGMDGTYARNTYPSDSRLDYQAWIAGATVSYGLPANLVVAASYQHWNRVKTHGNGPTTTTYYSNITFGYARVWR